MSKVLPAVGLQSMMQDNQFDDTAKDRYRPAAVIGPGLRRLLGVVWLLIALLAVNSVYLSAITLLEQATGESHQDAFYLGMFLMHLLLGLLLIIPFLLFGTQHMRRARKRPNRHAVALGFTLFTSGILVLLSGVLLTRFGFFEINDAGVRQAAYWVHVAMPLIAAWLFVLHRLAGHQIRWHLGLRWGAVAAVFAVAMVSWRLYDTPNDVGNHESAFATTLIQTPGGQAIAAGALMTDDFCAECHAEIAEQWRLSAHRFSSFNNPFYRFSVEETRKVSMATTGTMDKAQFCAGCHDPVPLLSGAFDDPGFDVVADPSAHAGLTCTSCHAITAINSVRGNADFTIEPPVRYPFEGSENAFLQAVGRQLIRAKPAYHRQGFLKPLHRSPQFCGSCHKAHMPPAVNDYRWLRGQNHYDSFLLSGVSGHRVDSFYYPDEAIESCASCHMPLVVTNDPAARRFDGGDSRKTHSHLFPAANTGLAHEVGLPDAAMEAHRRMLKGAARVDLFGLRVGGEVDGELTAPLDASGAVLEPGRRYLIEAVVRNLRVGHHLTQGTADSNQLWLDVTVRTGERVIGRSGAMGAQGRVDPWSHFVNAYVLTRDGERLDRRNGQDTFAALYDHQIAPGAAAVVHYAMTLPEDVQGPVTIEAALRYRKFDSTYLAHVRGAQYAGNDLPIVTLASDELTLPTNHATAIATVPRRHRPPTWERWNDYGIGLLLSGDGHRGALRQAEQAFLQVEAMGRPDGPLNLARVYLQEGRLTEAVQALARAEARHPEFRPWTRAWLTARVDRENGHLDAAIATLRDLLATRFSEAEARGFDFGRDYRARNLLGRTLYERARQARGADASQQRLAWLEASRDAFHEVLDDDPENLTAHHNLALVHAALGDSEKAAHHRRLVERYRPDDHAIEQAVATHRRNNPAASHAAEAVVVYDLQRPGAYGLFDGVTAMDAAGLDVAISEQERLGPGG